MSDGLKKGDALQTGRARITERIRKLSSSGLIRKVILVMGSAAQLDMY